MLAVQRSSSSYWAQTTLVLYKYSCMPSSQPSTTCPTRHQSRCQPFFGSWLPYGVTWAPEQVQLVRQVQQVVWIPGHIVQGSSNQAARETAQISLRVTPPGLVPLSSTRCPTLPQATIGSRPPGSGRPLCLRHSILIGARKIVDNKISICIISIFIDRSAKQGTFVGMSRKQRM